METTTIQSQTARIINNIQTQIIQKKITENIQYMFDNKNKVLFNLGLSGGIFTILLVYFSPHTLLVGSALYLCTFLISPRLFESSYILIVVSKIILWVLLSTLISLSILNSNIVGNSIGIGELHESPKTDFASPLIPLKSTASLSIPQDHERDYLRTQEVLEIEGKNLLLLIDLLNQYSPRPPPQSQPSTPFIEEIFVE